MVQAIQFFEHVAVRALKRLWSMRSPRGLLGTALNMELAAWLGSNGGIGASADSFYEYLLKAYVIFGESEPMHSPGCRIPSGRFPDPLRPSWTQHLNGGAGLSGQSCRDHVLGELLVHLSGPVFYLLTKVLFPTLLPIASRKRQRRWPRQWPSDCLCGHICTWETRCVLVMYLDVARACACSPAWIKSQAGHSACSRNLFTFSLTIIYK